MKSKKEVVIVLLHYDYSSYLLQLRDFVPYIDSPGKWGGFGGEMEPGETINSAACRELTEELHYTPHTIHEFQTYQLEHLISHVCHWELTVPFSNLIQSEGVDMGLFKKEEIFTGKLYAQKLKQYFPVAPLLVRFFKDFFDFIEDPSFNS